MKNKIAKKLLAATLVAAMAVSMAGCSGEETTGTEGDTTGGETTTGGDDAGTTTGGDDAGTTTGGDDAGTTTGGDDAGTTEEVSPYTVINDANGNPVDLGGIEVVIGDWFSSGEVAEPDNAYEEDLQAYREWIQETYNFTIVEKAIAGWGDAPENFVNYASMGGDEYYVFCLRSCATTTEAMNSGLMYDLSTLDCLDFSEAKWGGENSIHNQFTDPASGAVYAMRGIEAEPRGGVFFNKRLLEEADIDPNSIYELQENGEWTWEKFEEICEKVQRDVNSDGVTDVYGMVQQDVQFYRQAVWSNGGEFVGKDADGKFVNELETNETLEALNWAVEMRSNYEMPKPEGAEWNYFLTEFKNGKAAFFSDQEYQSGSLADMEDDFGFVCFPMGPNMTDYVNCFDDNSYVIPACYDADKAWKIAFAYNVYTDPVPGYEDVETWQATFYSKYRDTESVDNTIARLRENGLITYHLMVSGLNIDNELLYGLMSPDSETGEMKTPAQKAEALRNTWQAYIDNANN